MQDKVQTKEQDKAQNSGQNKVQPKQNRPQPTVQDKVAPKRDDSFNQLVRIANVDIDGDYALYYGLAKIKGVSFTFSGAACSTLNMNRDKKIGLLSVKEIGQIEDLLRDPKKYNFPSWMLNRRKDRESGEDKHLLTGDIKFTTENDIRRLQKIRARRGLRHAWGLPVRGQRTKANFRRGGALGVKRKENVKAGRM